MGNNGNGALYKKLATVMGELNRIPERGFNKFHNYKFVEAGDVLDAVRDALSNNGVAFRAHAVGHKRETLTTKRGEETYRTTVKVRFQFVCADTGETVESDWLGEAIDNQDKGINKAVTAATKYFLLKTFLISTGDEPDADAESVDRDTHEAVADNGRPTTSLSQQREKLLELVNERTGGYYNHANHMLNTLRGLPKYDKQTTWRGLAGSDGLLGKGTANELAALLIEYAASKTEDEAEQEAA